MEEDNRRRFFDPYHPQGPRLSSRPLWGHVLLSLVSVFGLSFCLTCLYLAMRGIMRLGGFVASGGPYEIAHPAPRYVWIFPVSIMVGLACVFIHGIYAGKAGGLNLAPLAWPALFISLGWNFLEFGFRPPGGESLAWGWLVCGVVFWLMGFIPLVFFALHFWQGFRERRFKARLKGLPTAEPGGGNEGRNTFLLLLQLAAILAGIYCGIIFLNSQIKPEMNSLTVSPAGESSIPT